MLVSAVDSIPSRILFPHIWSQSWLLKLNLTHTVDWGRKWLTDFNLRKAALVSLIVRITLVMGLCLMKNCFLRCQSCCSSKVNWSWYIVGNKAKRRISKQVLQENEARQIFRKTNISYPLLRQRWRALFSCNTRFEIRPFASYGIDSIAKITSKKIGALKKKIVKKNKTTTCVQECSGPLWFTKNYWQYFNT